MGRRSRQRATHDPPRDPSKGSLPVRRDRMARVAVADEVWADFRAAAGYRPVSEVLGELVEHEVARYRSRRLRDGQLEPREVVEALERARDQQDDLAAIVGRLEALREESG